jgi:hypothetical protein
METEKTEIVTGEDSDWIYGETYINDVKITDWMKPKEKFWGQLSWSDIIKKLDLRINQEMIKQTSIYEGDTNFIEELYLMCYPDWMELTDKQVNMMARIIMAHYGKVPALALKYAALSGLRAGKTNKEIEETIRKVVNKSSLIDEQIPFV